MFSDVPGIFRAVPGIFRAVPRIFRAVLGMFWGCSGLFRGYSVASWLAMREAQLPHHMLCAIKGHFLHTIPLLCVENAHFSHISLLKETFCAINGVFLRTVYLPDFG